MEYPVGTLVRDRRNFPDDIPIWEVVSKPTKGATIALKYYLKEPHGRRSTCRDASFLIPINYMENE